MLGTFPFHVNFTISLPIRNFFGILLEITLNYMLIWGGLISLLVYFSKQWTQYVCSSFLWFLSSSFKKLYLFIYFGCTGSFFFLISWRLITLQYCSGFCHTLTWISHWFTCIPHPDPPSHLPLHPISLGLPSARGPSTYLMHPTWAGDLFHPR